MLVSYAQNFEDVILWRALKHVQRGFYIDIGAEDPVANSVSLAFYENGWRGVHVEPTPANAARLRAARPDEDVVEAAITLQLGKISFFEVANTGLSTGKQTIAQTNEERGFKSNAIEVETLPLSELLNRLSDRDVHWLKIDVEGMEDEVIASWRPSSVRPWILCIESTLPNTQIEDFASWEPTIVELGYEFVYFDGINRFYLHRDHADLRSSFELGPNYFDDFAIGALTPFARKLAHDILILNAEIGRLHQENVDIGRLNRHSADLDKVVAAKQAALNELEKQNQEKDIEIGRLHQHIAEMERAATIERASRAEQHALLAEQLNHQLEAMLNSTSWRLTAPLRVLKHSTRVSAKWPRAEAKLICQHALLWLRRRPRAAATIRLLLCYSPWLQQRASALSRSLPAPVHIVDWALEPDQDALNGWRKLLRVSRGS